MDPPLYPDDIVVNKADQKQLAVVERTHEDVDTHSPFPGKTEREPINRDKTVPRAVFRRFMNDGIPPKGLVLVRWQTDPSLELMPTSKLVLLDRSLLIGDVVKRGVSDAMSGVVLNTFTKCTLQPMSDVTYQDSKTLKGILPPGDWHSQSSQAFANSNEQPTALVDIPASELMYAESPTEDDLVIYKDWIGRIDGITNNITIRLTDNCVVEIADELGEHVDGAMGTFCVGDIVKTKKGNLRTGNWIYGQYNPNTPPVGSVVFVRTASAEILWLQRRFASQDEHEPPFILEADELESPSFTVYDRTKRPVYALATADKLSETASNSEIDVRLNLRVRFRDLTGACLKYSDSSSTNQIPRLDRRENLGYDLNVFDVTSFHTSVTIQWQDLSISTEDSTDLVPDASIDDEHAAWPSEIAHSLDMNAVNPGMSDIEAPRQIGVIQSVNALDRMAKIRWCPRSEIHYSKDPTDDQVPPNVVWHKIDSTGSTEAEVSLYDVDAPAALNVRRGDIVLISPSDSGIPHFSLPGDVDWLGEIVDTLLNGNLIVRLGAARHVRDVELSREQCIVAIRSDGTGHLDGWENEDDLAFGDSEEDDLDFAEDSDLSDWDDGEEDTVEVTYQDEDGNPMNEDDVEDEAWESDDEMEEAEDIGMTDVPNQHEQSHTPQSKISVEPSLGRDTRDDTGRAELAVLSSEAPVPYTILDSEVPQSHHFRNESPTSTPVHMKRTQKEHRILRNPSTLPEGVYIRTWESRLDLLRVLLIGPTETPYANAPFVVDFYLPPSFPAEPPQAFFHSWPALVTIGGIGRVNPNLYEDGKICLSILGTWDGNKSEGWTAARSTLLQVIVSLLGLVLVREPYFNEAGYEPLVGSEASKRPSALYSERIFLRAKGFLVTALSSLSPTASERVAPGVEELEDILRWLYVNPSGPKLLDAMTKEVEVVLERSEEGGESDGLTLMSRGACIPLKRVLDKLRELHA